MKFARKNALDLRFDDSILREMIERLEFDSELSKRHGLVSGLARFALRSGIVKLFEFSPVNRFQPYMCIELKVA